MLVWSTFSTSLLFLAVVLLVESSQLEGTKVNSIKATLMGEEPTQPTNRSTTFHQGLTLGGSSGKKGKLLGQVGKGLKHYHRQGEVGPSFSLKNSLVATHFFCSWRKIQNFCIMG